MAAAVMAVGTEAVTPAATILVAAILAVMASGTRMAGEGIMADSISQQELDMVARASVRSAMQPSAQGIFITPSTSTPVPSAMAG